MNNEFHNYLGYPAWAIRLKMNNEFHIHNYLGYPCWAMVHPDHPQSEVIFLLLTNGKVIITKNRRDTVLEVDEARRVWTYHMEGGWRVIWKRYSLCPQIGDP